MKTTDEWMAETMQPILDRIAGPQFSPLVPRFHTCKAADRLPEGCDGCKETLDGRLVCCVNQTDEE